MGGQGTGQGARRCAPRTRMTLPVFVLILLGVSVSVSAAALPTSQNASQHKQLTQSRSRNGGATATPTCVPIGAYRVMVAYADSVSPNTFVSQLYQEPSILVVDL